MPVPKRKRSRARIHKRFANKGIKELAITHCSQCQHPLVPHRACNNCGFYKGAKVMSTKDDRYQKRKDLKRLPEKKTTEEVDASTKESS